MMYVLGFILPFYVNLISPKKLWFNPSLGLLFYDDDYIYSKQDNLNTSYSQSQSLHVLKG